jgi:hypothetical protein
VAIPSLPVVTVCVVSEAGGSVGPTAPPPLATVNTTETPDCATFDEFRTSTVIGAGVDCPRPALWLLPELIASVFGVDAVAVKLMGLLVMPEPVAVARRL